MSEPWHRRQPSLLNDLRQELERRYLDLSILLEDDVVYLRGGFPVVHNGVELDRFQIEVRIPQEFPNDIPIVREVGGRVPIGIPEWHTYDNGSLCIIVPEEWLINPQSGSVVAFLDSPVRNFFIAHALAETGIKRPMGERPHGSRGLLETYGEWVGSNEPTVIENYFDCLSMERIPRQWFCPCASGQKLRRCHGEQLKTLQKKIPFPVAAKALRRLRFQIARDHDFFTKNSNGGLPTK
jgi:hypothetical protein